MYSCLYIMVEIRVQEENHKIAEIDVKSSTI
jgi:hypothetical protein